MAEVAPAAHGILQLPALITVTTSMHIPHPTPEQCGCASMLPWVEKIAAKPLSRCSGIVPYDSAIKIMNIMAQHPICNTCAPEHVPPGHRKKLMLVIGREAMRGRNRPAIEEDTDEIMTPAALATLLSNMSNAPVVHTQSATSTPDGKKRAALDDKPPASHSAPQTTRRSTLEDLISAAGADDCVDMPALIPLDARSKTQQRGAASSPKMQLTKLLAKGESIVYCVVIELLHTIAYF